MAVFALVSAKGSPGVTTTLVALARAWHGATGRRALGVDLDPHGGDIAAGALLGAAPPGTGVLALATARADDPYQAVMAASTPVSDGGSRLVPGVPDTARAGAIPLAWDVLAAALPQLDEAGIDVIVDGGRVDGAAPWPAWMGDVDFGVLIVRPSLAWVCAAHRVASAWPREVALELVVVDSPSPYAAAEVGRAVGRPVLDVLPFDAAAAAVNSEGARPRRNHRRGAYSRGVDRLAAVLVSSQRASRSTGVPLPGAALAASSNPSGPRGGDR